jgi:short-subunit dehydrogenase
MNDATGRIVIFGGTSGIGRAIARELAGRGDELVLVGRDPAALEAEADDLKVRFGARPETFAWDLEERDRHAERFAALVAGGPVYGVVFTTGVMYEEHEAEAAPEKIRRNFDVNLVEPVVVLGLFARHLRARGAGFLSVLSSVAGDRGRASNKTYGASKAALSAWLEGLRGALHGSGVLVQTVKPGPVRTPMTAAYKGPAALLADPARVARVVVRAIEQGRPTVYAPGYWRYVMALIRALPEFLARKVPG